MGELEALSNFNLKHYVLKNGKRETTATVANDRSNEGVSIFPIRRLNVYHFQQVNKKLSHTPKTKEPYPRDD